MSFSVKPSSFAVAATSSRAGKFLAAQVASAACVKSSVIKFIQQQHWLIAKAACIKSSVIVAVVIRQLFLGIGILQAIPSGPPPARAPRGGMDATGQIVREGALSNTRPALAKLLAEYPRATVALEAGTHSPWISRYLTGLGAKVIVGNRCLDDARRRPTGIRTRCKRCNAAEGDVVRFCGIVVCPVNTGDLAVFRQIGRSVAKTAVSCWNGRLFRLDVPAV